MVICFCNIPEWVQALGSIATIGTFIYLILDRNKQQNQINELTKLAKVAEQRLKLSVMPNFVEIQLPSGLKGIAGSSFTIQLKNKGAKAIINSITEKNGKLSIKYDDKPVENESQFVIVATTLANENPLNSDYEIEIIFKDIVGIKYSQKIVLQNANCKLLLAHEVE